MKIQLVVKPLSEISTGNLIIPIFEDEKPPVNGMVEAFLKDNPKFGKPLETQLIYSPEKQVLLVGLGKREKFNFETCQNYGGTAVKSLLNKVKEVILVIPQVVNLESEEVVYAVGLGMELAAHDPSQKYKSEKNPPKLTQVELAVEKNSGGLQTNLKKALVVAEAINLARLLGDMPANEMTPKYFLGMARKIARENKLKVTILDEKKAATLGMGAFASVARGSDETGYLIALEYRGNLKDKERWGIVGKGITFDSGGISIKPGNGMHEMKYDMCGAANVLGLMQAIGTLKPKANIVGVMAVTENLPSGKASKPGDIIKSYSGKTVEILNTDAEGRMVLIDALSWAQKNLKTTRLIDLATLTGAMVISLGNFITGVFGNNSEFINQLIESGRKVGERYWELPLDEEFSEMIKSDIADITNIGHGGSMPGAAGSITGAKFIESAIKDNNVWIHLDIAGTAWDLKPRPFRGPGASGVGIKTLIELIAGE